MTEPGRSCPCGSGNGYAECCEPLHEGAAAVTAEALMRSRYAAYAVGDAAYLLRTWHPRTRPERIDLDGRTRWVGLDVRQVAGGAADDETGTVCFVAAYQRDGRPGELAETSEFVRRAGRWVYLDGERGTAIG